MMSFQVSFAAGEKAHCFYRTHFFPCEIVTKNSDGSSDVKFLNGQEMVIDDGLLRKVRDFFRGSGLTRFRRQLERYLACNWNAIQMLFERF